MEDVRKKIKENALLSSINEKKIIDKVRSLFRNEEHVSLEEMPKDSVAEKVERMFQSELASTGASEKPSTPSTSTKGLFSQQRAEDLVALCKRMITDGKIHKTVIEETLGSTNKGRALLQDFDIEQLRNRIKYERLKFIKAQANRK